MNIEVIVLGIGLMMCAYMIGYRIGYRDCFEYIKEELKKYKEKYNKWLNVIDAEGKLRILW